MAKISKPNQKSKNVKELVLLDKYQTRFNIPTIGWDKPAYVVLEGALRQFKFKSIVFPTDNVEDGYSFLNFEEPEAYVDIAGIGLVPLELQHLKYIYDSVDEYKSDMYNTYNKHYHEVPLKEWLPMCFGKEYIGSIAEKSIHDGCGLEVKRYKWDGIKAIQVNINFCKFVMYDNVRGFHFAEDVQLPENTYATKKECEENNKVKVVCFEDEEKEEEYDIVVTYSCGGSVSAKSKEEAIKKFMDNMADKPIFVEDVKAKVTK